MSQEATPVPFAELTLEEKLAKKRELFGEGPALSE